MIIGNVLKRLLVVSVFLIILIVIFAIIFGSLLLFIPVVLFLFIVGYLWKKLRHLKNDRKKKNSNVIEVKYKVKE